MATELLPPIHNVAAFVERIGSWNLYDLVLTDVRCTADDSELVVEADIVVPPGLWRGVAGRPEPYELVTTFQFRGVRALELSRFDAVDDIADYACETVPHTEGMRTGVRFRVRTHLAGDVFLIEADEAAVTRVVERPTPDASSA